MSDFPRPITQKEAIEAASKAVQETRYLLVEPGTMQAIKQALFDGRRMMEAFYLAWMLSIGYLIGSSLG